MVRGGKGGKQQKGHSLEVLSEADGEGKVTEVMMCGGEPSAMEEEGFGGCIKEMLLMAER